MASCRFRPRLRSSGIPIHSARDRHRRAARSARQKIHLEEAGVLVVLVVAAVIIEIRFLLAVHIGLFLFGLAAGHGLISLTFETSPSRVNSGSSASSSKSSMSSIRSVNSALVGPASCAHDAIPPEWIGHEFGVLVGGVILPRHLREPLGVLGLADAPEELDGFTPLRLRLAPCHHFGHLTVDGTS